MHVEDVRRRCALLGDALPRRHALPLAHLDEPLELPRREAVLVVGLLVYASSSASLIEMQDRSRRISPIITQ